MSTVFNLTNLSTKISSDIAILFPEESDVVDDGNALLDLYCSKDVLNQIFLFKSTAGENSDNALEVSSSTSPILYAMNAEQWNPSYQTSQVDRLWVFKHLLEDLFGFGGDIDVAGAVHTTTSGNVRNDNIDALTLDNQKNLDHVIVDEFMYEAQEQQRANMYKRTNGHGAFKLENGASLNALNIKNGIIAMANATDSNGALLYPAGSTVGAPCGISGAIMGLNTLTNSADEYLSAIAFNNNSTSSITRSLLQQAAAKAKTDQTNVLSRQFDGTNNSTQQFALPEYWRTFQFVEGDKLNFNITFQQLADLPLWSAVARVVRNPHVAYNGEAHNSNTLYKVQLTVKDDLTTVNEEDICVFRLNPNNEAYATIVTQGTGRKDYASTPGVHV